MAWILDKHLSHKLPVSSHGDQTEAIAMLTDDSDFICRVLNFLPNELKTGYGSDDSDLAEHEDEAPKFDEDRQAELRDKLQAKLQILRARSGSLRAQKNIRKRLNKMEKRKLNQKQQSGKGGAVNSKINAVKTAKKRKLIERRSKPALPSKGMQSKPVFNTEGKMVFSKFDFASSEDPGKGKRKKMSLKAELSLAREKRAKKRSQGTGADDNEAWQTAQKKAKGEKIRDDPKLLAKSLRREQQKKKLSEKRWEERIQNEKQKREQRQNKRLGNINDRRDQKKKKVVEKLKKKGRILPGF
ncbi:surfeit locus protein 6 homolog isoform X2 [Pollicipes pollicipes]|uniref:surfeit locus protein 6 homolog isoform X2 n=1 Tax=Pollicipes pollicipes TaxID=41117 RepID=UPI0018853A10|nr:surfeit locus protein 6 homolog isoform X2 [Pollicipes pollicipes]